MFQDSVGQLYLVYYDYVRDCEKKNIKAKNFLTFIIDSFKM